MTLGNNPTNEDLRILITIAMLCIGASLLILLIAGCCDAPAITECENCILEESFGSTDD